MRLEKWSLSLLSGIHRVVFNIMKSQDPNESLNMYKNESIEAACKQECDWVEVLRNKKVQFLVCFHHGFVK